MGEALQGNTNNCSETNQQIRVEMPRPQSCIYRASLHSRMPRAVARGIIILVSVGGRPEKESQRRLRNRGSESTASIVLQRTPPGQQSTSIDSQLAVGRRRRPWWRLEPLLHPNVKFWILVRDGKICWYTAVQMLCSSPVSTIPSCWMGSNLMIERAISGPPEPAGALKIFSQ